MAVLVSRGRAVVILTANSFGRELRRLLRSSYDKKPR